MNENQTHSPSEVSAVPKRTNRKYTIEQKQVFVSEFLASGKNRSVFCRERDLSYLSFGQWVEKFSPQAKTSSSSSSSLNSAPLFRELSLVPKIGFGVMEIEFSGKGVVRIERECPENWVKEVLGRLS
jgi:transposase-like protein